MQNSNRPRRLVKPFGAAAGSGFIRQVPIAAQPNGAASYDTGFPPETFQPVASGGSPPSGQDMNGVLFDATANAMWAAAGGIAQFDAAYVSAIGGYALGARLASVNNPAIAWVSMVDNNTGNPDAGAPNWVIEGVGGSNPNLAGGYYQFGPFTLNFGNVVQAGSSGASTVSFQKPFTATPLLIGATNDCGGTRPSAWAGVGNASNTGMVVGMSVTPSGGGSGTPAPAGTAAWWWAIGI